MNKKVIILIGLSMILLAFFANHAIEKAVADLNEEVVDLKTIFDSQRLDMTDMYTVIQNLEKKVATLEDDKSDLQAQLKEAKDALQTQNDVVKALEVDAIDQWRELQAFQSALYLYHAALVNTDRLEIVYGFYSGHDDDLISIDYCEWLTEPDDRQKLDALGIEEDTLSNGYYIHDVDDVITFYPLDPYTGFYLLNGAVGQTSHRDQFFAEIEIGTLLILKVLDGRVMEVSVAYRP